VNRLAAVWSQVLHGPKGTRDIIPGLHQLAILANVANRGAALELEAAEAAAHSLSLNALRLEIRGDEDIALAIKPLNGRADALHVCVDPLVNSKRGAPFTTAGFARMVERAGSEAKLKFCGVRSPPIFQWSKRRSSSWSSVSRRPKR
jgi:hypothetical protein